ncbi:hypothetical protein [Fusobacterium mortiferum]|uniref:Uncharacterized protein n=3 Tax=Fusobacterium mortiferum TaxID=850 RepID=A0ABM6TXB4_FUSMR|nr:hypothetical protein [Fusobacterium mortiferum]AVQ18916.1 hypothetical protein C4N19_07325 [Fusobacterium mortiferum ATCC 9817]
MFDGITKRGSEYLAKCQATGEGIKLVKVKIGDGKISDDEDPSTFTNIKAIKQEVEILEKKQIENNLKLTVLFSNEDIETGYFPREIGIYALDGEEEILYWYINEGDEATWMPPASKTPIKFRYYVNIMATNNETTIVNWTGKELWVDKEYLDKELAKKQNLHENRLLTAAKIVWEAINELFTNKLDKGGYTGTAQNLLTEISKIASKTILGRIIIGKGLTVDSSGRTSIVSKNDGIIVNDNDIQLNVVDNLTTDSTTKALSGKQGKILNETKQNKEDSTLKTVVKTIVGAINELYNELVKKATKTQLGRIKVGNNLTVDEDGTLHGTPEYTHPTGNGNNHIPANGVSGNFLKWLSSGAAQWTNITWSDITGKPNSFTPSSHNHTKANITDFPTSMKNPYALSIQLNSGTAYTYDGAATKNINITPASIGAADSSHTHTKANITDFPASMKNPYALSIQLNSGTAYTYDGAATKNINITPASIGAADSSHTHTKANITDFPTSMKNPNALEIKMNGQNPVSYDGAAAKSINITASGIGAEPAFKKNGAFNKNFGTTSNTVLEGAKLAEILGLTYGGSLNTSSAKTVNYAYYDSTTKKVYKCIKATSINYADANCFEAISNNDLLSKLQNFIISSGSNTNGYYRKYSDGFIEQFGTFNFSGGTNASIKRTLPISMKTTNYIVVCNPNFALERNSAAWGIVNPTTKTTTTITFKKAHSETTDVYWYVCGY